MRKNDVTRLRTKSLPEEENGIFRGSDAVRLTERDLLASFRCLRGYIGTTDADGRLTDVDAEFCRRLNYSADRLLGTSLFMLTEMASTGTPATEKLQDKDCGGNNGFIQFREFFRLGGRLRGRPLRFRRCFICENGDRVALNFSLSAVFDRGGNIRNCVLLESAKPQESDRRRLLENRHWIFDFLSSLRQFDDIELLFGALKTNLSAVTGFSSLKLIIPSYMSRSWVLESGRGFETDTGRVKKQVAALLNGTGAAGYAYAERATFAGHCPLREKTPGEELSTAETHALLAAPLLYSDTRWGVLELTREGDRPFLEWEAAIVSIVAGNTALYLEQQSRRVEPGPHADYLQRLHSMIRILLRTRNRDRLIDEMLKFLKEVVPASSCAVYLLSEKDGAKTLSRISGYDREDISMPDSVPVLNVAFNAPSWTECREDGKEVRQVLPITLQTRNVGAVDLYKPSGLLPIELKMFRLLVDYVTDFWDLYDLMALHEQEASIDPLTGIWNRRYMIRRLEEEGDRITRYGGNICVVIGDMGNFKEVNDTFGHAKGDEVLIKSASGIRKNLRLSDSAGRYGGDEFFLLLPNVTSADAVTIVRRLEREMSQLQIRCDNNPESPLIEVVMDFGFAIFPGQAATLMDTIRLADEAMYAAKTARKKRAEKRAQEKGRVRVRGKTHKRRPI